MHTPSIFLFITQFTSTLRFQNFPQFTSLKRLQWRPMRELSQFTSLERLKKEQFWHKMASAERGLVSTSFVMHYYCHLLVSHPTKTNMYTAIQYEIGVSCLTITVNKRQLTMPYGGKKHERHSLKLF
jgi:hypothetical protein